MLAAYISNLQWRIKTLFEFSSVDVILTAGIFILIVVYIAILIRLKPSLKNKESTEADLNSETPPQTPNEEPVRTSVQPTTIPVKTKERVQELPRNIETPEEPEAGLQMPKELVLPPPKEVSKIKEKLTQKAKKTPKKPGPPGCSYYFGYLGELPKNTPIPDECLGCLKIMECLIKRSANSET